VNWYSANAWTPYCDQFYQPIINTIKLMIKWNI
jgi:hypothetical protein